MKGKFKPFITTASSRTRRHVGRSAGPTKCRTNNAGVTKSFRAFITFSREAGSGGKLIAQKVVKELGLEFYDKKLLELIARKAGRRKKVIAKLDEKERGFLTDLVNSLLNPEYLAEQTYIKSLCEVIKALSLKGGCVILGRGGNFITSRRNGLHVRVIAPFWVRVNYTVQYEHRSVKNAISRVRKHDRHRKEFIKQYFDKDPSNTNYYDLVINTQYLSIDEAVEAVETAYREKFKK